MLNQINFKKLEDEYICNYVHNKIKNNIEAMYKAKTNKAIEKVTIDNKDYDAMFMYEYNKITKRESKWNMKVI